MLCRTAPWAIEVGPEGGGGGGVGEEGGKDHYRRFFHLSLRSCVGKAP